MRGKLWLSEAININQIQCGFLNIIKAPCGSGKTHCALHELSKLATVRAKCLYVIDTTNGREQILQNANTAPFGYEWAEYMKRDKQDIVTGEIIIEKIDENKMVVVSYAKLGSFIKYNPKFVRQLEVVICDELHNGVEFASYEKGEMKPNYAKIAIDNLLHMVMYSDKIKVIALTATPNKAAMFFKDFVNYIPVHKDVREYTETKTETFTNCNSLLNSIYTQVAADTKGIIYTPRINEMIKIQDKLTHMNIKAVAVWSEQNIDYIITDEQKKARLEIINNESMPIGYDVLIINKAMETGVNIKAEKVKVDYVIVHSQEKDVQIQARGRYRGDLPMLYLYSNDENTVIDVPIEFMNRKLFKADKAELCDVLRLRNKQGNIVGWDTVKGRLKNQGYTVKDGQSGTRYSIITK
jgi:KaiC/GvpD/RAD55 family RecA-like ATPase